MSRKKLYIIVLSFAIAGYSWILLNQLSAEGKQPHPECLFIQAGDRDPLPIMWNYSCSSFNCKR